MIHMRHVNTLQDFNNLVNHEAQHTTPAIHSTVRHTVVKGVDTHCV